MGKGVFTATALAAVALTGCAGSNQALHDARAAAQVRAAQARTIARQAGLGPDVQDFLARAAGASAERYTVIYSQGAGQTTTVISDPPDRRIDVFGASGAESLDRVIVKGTTNYICHRTGRKWSCTQGGPATPVGPFTPDAITQTIGSLVQLSDTYTFTVTQRRLIGLTGTCLSADRKPDQPASALASSIAISDHGAICIAPNGVILRVEGVGSPLIATSYRTSVPSRAFDLPATASPPPTA